jgi:glycosyltransferase involved in cell wall biosynthesis
MASTAVATSALRVGIDATCWANRRGYGRHARGLVGALLGVDTTNRYTLFVDSPIAGAACPVGADIQMVQAARATAVAAAADGHRSVTDIWRMSRALSAADLDVLLFPTVYSYVPVITTAKKIVVIHDVIVETYPKLTVPGTVSRWLWDAKVKAARWQADALVTVSEHSRRGIIERFNVPADSVFVVGEAGDPVFEVLDRPEPTSRLRSLGVARSRRSIVYVGGFGPHKNLRMLVDAFARLASCQELGEVNLVMVGDDTHEAFYSEVTAIKALVRERGLTGRVIFTGYLPDNELVVLLNLATLLVLPSLLEGFGLPAVEAAACGCPVVATRHSPLPEVLGEGGMYVDPTSQSQLEAALIAVLTSESRRLKMRHEGLAHARQLTWDAAATQMLKVIHEVGHR